VALGVTVGAEGVETLEQLEQVRAHGCRLAQGFHFAGPLDAAAFAAFVQDAPAW
jgi:EAL domain-containing protein (putative c-di-GMP-specific phosphodiesterase class I)